jgi:serine/threonine protein kinase
VIVRGGGAGVVLYVITAGCLPFDEPSLPALFEHITKADYVTPPWFSEELCALLRKILCVNPAERITLEQLAVDPWVTAGGSMQIAPGTMTPIANDEASNIFSSNSVSAFDVQPSQAQALRGFSRVNAFILISAAIDLSAIFEQRKVLPLLPPLELHRSQVLLILLPATRMIFVLRNSDS